MKISVIHGENSSASATFLKSALEALKGKGIEISRISSESKLNLIETLTSDNLFFKKSVFVLENPTKIAEKEIKWLVKNADRLRGELYIYHDSVISASIVRKLSEVSDVREFKLPKTIFSFLDTFAPGQARRCLLYLHELLKKEPPEFILALLGRHLRDLYWVKVAPESLEYPDWKTSKLKSQAALFKEEKLKKLINLLAKIDVSTKTSSQKLGSSLDLLIASQLQ